MHNYCNGNPTYLALEELGMNLNALRTFFPARLHDVHTIHWRSHNVSRATYRRAFFTLLLCSVSFSAAAFCSLIVLFGWLDNLCACNMMFQLTPWYCSASLVPAAVAGSPDGSCNSPWSTLQFRHTQSSAPAYLRWYDTCVQPQCLHIHLICKNWHWYVKIEKNYAILQNFPDKKISLISQ